MDAAFPALVVEQAGAPARLVTLGPDDLDPGEVTVAVEFSSMNYKDALAVTASGPIVRRFPMVCGIDLAGRVVASQAAEVPLGARVVVTGCGLGEERFGGFASFARVPSACCVALPEGLDARRAMALGTAGMTAMLSFFALERAGSGPGELDGLPLLVTGALGGVGSLAVVIGSRLGYEVLASTGRPSEEAFLRRLGAAGVIDRTELSDAPPRPLSRARFGAAVDVVGGTTLANVLSSLRPGGAAAASGLVGGTDVATTVHPFILRGVTLAGINSVTPPNELRLRAWRALAELVPFELLDGLTREISLGEVPEVAAEMLAGRSHGRVVVSLGSTPG